MTEILNTYNTYNFLYNSSDSQRLLNHEKFCDAIYIKGFEFGFFNHQKKL